MVVQEEEIVIVGGGIAGLATALALRRVGFSARVLERSPELRASGAELALFPNAWYALRALGVHEKLASMYRPMEGTFVMNLETGATQEFNLARLEQREETKMRAVHRKVLLEVLAEELPPDTITYSSKLISFRNVTLEDFSKVTFLHLEDGTIIKAKVAIGCDGVHSVVAQWLGLSQPTKAGRSTIRGLSVFPEGHGFKMQIKQYLRDGIRVGIIPLNSTDLSWFLVDKSSGAPEKNLPSSPDLILKEVITNFVKDFPSDVVTIVKNTNLSTLTVSPLAYRSPWSIIVGRAHNTNVTVAGDAMHPMTPELGQGGGSALEDAVILARCLSEARHDKHWPEAALQKYVEQRRWRVAWIVACAWCAGKVQNGGGTSKEWWSGAVKWFKHQIFYKFIFPWIGASLWYDCGDLIPTK